MFGPLLYIYHFGVLQGCPLAGLGPLSRSARVFPIQTRAILAVFCQPDYCVFDVSPRLLGT